MRCLRNLDQPSTSSEARGLRNLVQLITSSEGILVSLTSRENREAQTLLDNSVSWPGFFRVLVLKPFNLIIVYGSQYIDMQNSETPNDDVKLLEETIFAENFEY